MAKLVSVERIENKIFHIRGKKVMLDKHLAELYGVANKVLIQAVKRNIRRFPSDFMFLLTDKEVTNLRSQFVTSKQERRDDKKTSRAECKKTKEANEEGVYKI